MTDEHITLRWQSTDPVFTQRLSALEQAMLEKNIAPSGFTIQKDMAPFQPITGTGIAWSAPSLGNTSTAYDYTVFVGGESFKVSKYGDLDFLDYFSSLCMAAADDKAAPAAHHNHLLVKEIRKIIGWLEKEPFEGKKS